MFEVPTEDAAHIIAAEPIIDNVNVIHHIIIWGCQDDYEPTDVSYAHVAEVFIF